MMSISAKLTVYNYKVVHVITTRGQLSCNGEEDF